MHVYYYSFKVMTQFQYCIICTSSSRAVVLNLFAPWTTKTQKNFHGPPKCQKYHWWTLKLYNRGLNGYNTLLL